MRIVTPEQLAQGYVLLAGLDKDGNFKVRKASFSGAVKLPNGTYVVRDPSR